MRPVVVILLLAFVVAACERTVVPSVAPPSPSPSGVLSGDRPAAELFAAVRTGTGGAPEVIGSYTRGCIAGAEQLPLDAPRWQVMRPSRHRSWGHPALIRFVGGLADDVAKEGVRGLLIGDLGQPRGGPSPSDHNSHQVGLDADIWLTPMPAGKVPSRDLETFAPVAMVDFSTLRVTAAFGSAQVAMLSRAARAEEVERIFVSPPIKRALCLRVKGDRSWLGKVRPWPGHYWHMHVRLGCPAGSPACKPQEAPPPGDGCGAELQSWFDKPDWAHPSEGTYEPDKAIRLDALPDACRRVLAEQG